ncbi:MAG: tetratricopeptide repeat protein [Kiritimatiellaceae bacterium]|nr:tetratricopeptide repeat protein [Kiritimatiellaceae bacterium]
MRISRKVRISEALLAGVLLFVGGCASPSKPQLSVNTQAGALSHFSLGLLAEAGGDSMAALEHLQTAIRLDPNEEKLYAPAVALALKLGETNNAVRLARDLAKNHPGASDPQLLLARVYTLTGKPDQAEALFRKIRSDFPEDHEPPVFLAQFYFLQNRRTEAMETLRSASVTQKENAELFHLLGTLCVDRARELGDTPEARAAVQEGVGFFQQSLRIAPLNSSRWQQLGFAQLAVKQLSDAQNSFQEARRYAPADLPLARQLFDLLIQTGKYDEAMEAYEKLAAETGTEPELWLQYLAEKMPEQERVRLAERLEAHIREQSPAPVFYYAQLGSLYIGAKKNQEAKTVLLEALGHYPNDNRLRTVLGYLHLQQEHYSEAYTALEQVRTESPEAEWSNNPFFLFNFLAAAQKSDHLEEAARTLAVTYTNNPAILNQYMLSLLSGRPPASTESTIALLNAFRTLNPDASEVLYYLMLLQAEKKEYTKAIETAQQFESVAQKSGSTNLLGEQFYYQYASLYERTGQLETAEKLFLKVIERGEKTTTAAAQNYIAYMWAERGEKLDAGLALVRKALITYPENGAFLDTLGWIYYMQGRYAEALKELQKASVLVEDDPSVWEHLGDTCQKLGRRDAAVAYWKKALEIKPADPDLLKRLEASGIKSDESLPPADSPADTTLRP